tara:strand:+ start:3211 stop:4155 length:945 start_codon:yes stop_codon:yes gene_type:complete
MFETLYYIFTSNNPNLYFLRLVLIIAIILLLVILSKQLQNPVIRDGFTQKEQFVCKQNDNANDEFYADIYDSLHNTKKRSQKELINIIEMTEPSSEYSTFLDVGCGTGYIVNELNEAGYDAYGIDKSKDMLTHAQLSYPDAEYVYGDVLDSMQFEKSTFTHILCTYFTIYSFDDKPKFFRNCYHWMKPNTYLVVHLVDTDKFTNMIPYNETYNEEKRTGSHRKITTNAMFSDYEYKCSLTIPNDNNQSNSQLNETFVDIETNHIRQNEFKLYMDSIEQIIKIASNNGFIIKGKVDMQSSNGDKNQYLYILERPL